MRFTLFASADLYDDPFVKYFVVEFSEEARQCVNSHAIIDEGKKGTGSPPKRVLGNNRRSVTVEVRTKE